MVICPSCGSSRIRNDYKPAPLVLRTVGVRALLCDSCNFQFRAFSPVPPKSRRPRYTNRKADVFNGAEAVDLDQIKFNSPPAERREPKLTLPISAKPTSSIQPMQMGQMQMGQMQVGQMQVGQMQVGQMQMRVAVATAQQQSGIVVEQVVAPVRQDLRTEITKLYAQEAEAELKSKSKSSVQAADGPLVLTCPECGSHSIKRRKRNLFERVFLSITEHKPYICRKCDMAFYSKSIDQE